MANDVRCGAMVLHIHIVNTYSMCDVENKQHECKEHHVCECEVRASVCVGA